MTPKTTLHKIVNNSQTIIFRDLNVLEISYLTNIKNEVMKYDFAAKACVIEPTDLTLVPWPILQQIGQSSLYNSTRWVNDQQLFEILVKDCRRELMDGTSPMGMIKKIIEVFPAQPVTELLKLTWKDLVELVCLAELVVGKKIFNIAGGPAMPKKGMKLATAASSEEKQTLQEKINALNVSLGGIPK